MPASKMETGLIRIPEDVYEATYLGADEIDIIEKKTNKAVHLLEHKFEVKGPEGFVTLKQLSSIQMTLGNRTGQIGKAISGREVPVGELFEFNDHKGKKLRILVKDKIVQQGNKSDIKEFMSLKPIEGPKKDFPVGAP